MRSRVWRVATVSAALVAAGGPVAVAQEADVIVASGEPPVVATAEPVIETGTVDGATVAVGLPPVPPAAVEVGLAPVPPAPLPYLPDTGDGGDDTVEVAASIAGTIAGIAGAAWRD